MKHLQDIKKIITKERKHNIKCPQFLLSVHLRDSIYKRNQP